MSQPRKWIIFSIRDLIWLTLVVGLASGWFVQARRWDALLTAYEAEQSKWETETQNERTARLTAEVRLEAAQSIQREFFAAKNQAEIATRDRETYHKYFTEVMQELRRQQVENWQLTKNLDAAKQADK